MSTYNKVQVLLNQLVDRKSFINVLDIGKVNKLSINPEFVNKHPNWFDFIDTNKFCNTYLAFNAGTKFTTVEREFRRVREHNRVNVNDRY